jgi:hypothetical protein
MKFSGLTACFPEKDEILRATKWKLYFNSMEISKSQA